MVLSLVNLKARFGWSNKSFTELLVLLKNLFPEQNTLPQSQYEAKKILCPVGMSYQKIHACPNDCILYRNEFAEMRNCPTCGVSRYKPNTDDLIDDISPNNTRPAKVMDCSDIRLIVRNGNNLINCSCNGGDQNVWACFPMVDVSN